MSATSLSLALLRGKGYKPQVVEYWHHKAKVRVDLYGCIDIIAVHPEHGILAVQATTHDGGNVAKHIQKAREKLPWSWLLHARYEVWGWPRGSKKHKPETVHRRALILGDSGFEEMKVGYAEP